MRKLFATIVVALGLGLAACGTIPGFEYDASASDRLLGLEIAYGTVFLMAVEYENLPRCFIVDTPICSDQEVVDKMREAHIAVVQGLDSAWKVIYATNVDSEAKDVAIAIVETTIDDAKELYNSIRDVILGSRKLMVKGAEGAK